MNNSPGLGEGTSMNDPLGVLNEMPLSQNTGANGSESNGNQHLMMQIIFND
jgi:phosphotransferase system IIB component